MKIKLAPGKYVVAVSGGVDSAVLLDVLHKMPELELIVAHFDHGIRANSAEDRKFVEELAKKHKLPFEYAAGKLGVKASEAVARQKRYEFLHRVKNKTNAQTIITAHHQDDLIETAILNWLRGSGRLGLSSLQSTAEITRPLLTQTKKDLVAYAKIHNLSWREDSTNADEKYLRNYVRRQIMPKLSAVERTKLLNIIDKATVSNKAINTKLSQALSSQASAQQLDRQWFVDLPHNVAKEIMASWLRQNNIELDRKLIERLVVAAKTYQVGKRADVNKDYQLKISRQHLALEHSER